MMDTSMQPISSVFQADQGQLLYKGRIHTLVLRENGNPISLSSSSQDELAALVQKILQASEHPFETLHQVTISPEGIHTPKRQFIPMASAALKTLFEAIPRWKESPASEPLVQVEESLPPPRFLPLSEIVEDILIFEEAWPQFFCGYRFCFPTTKLMPELARQFEESEQKDNIYKFIQTWLSEPDYHCNEFEVEPLFHQLATFFESHAFFTYLAKKPAQEQEAFFQSTRSLLLTSRFLQSLEQWSLKVDNRMSTMHLLKSWLSNPHPSLSEQYQKPASIRAANKILDNIEQSYGKTMADSLSEAIAARVNQEGRLPVTRSSSFFGLMPPQALLTDPNAPEEVFEDVDEDLIRKVAEMDQDIPKTDPDDPARYNIDRIAHFGQKLLS